MQRWPASLVSAPLGRVVAPAFGYRAARRPLGVQDGGARNFDPPRRTMARKEGGGAFGCSPSLNTV